MLGRILLATLALLMAIPAGVFVFIAGALLDPALREAFARLGLAGLLTGFVDLAAGLPPGMAATLLAALARALAVLLVLPPVLTVLIGETFRLRSPLWYGGFCAALTAALPWLARGATAPPAGAAVAEARLSALLFATGAASGLLAWLIVGRTAGARRHEPGP